MFTHLHRRISLALGLLCATMLAAPSAAAAPPVPAAVAVAVSGTWVGSDPITITGVSQRGSLVVLHFAGTTTWSGTLNGSTTYTGAAVVHPDTHLLLAPVVETFTGQVEGVGSGTLQLSELLKQDTRTGAVTVTAHVTGGTADLTDLRGTLHFIGVSDANGIGAGTYTGQLATTHA